MSDDYTTTTETAGRVAVGGSATGEIEAAGDRDWFAVEFEAGRTYRIDLRGSPTGDGTLADTFLRRILDSEGNKSTGDGSNRTYNDNHGGSVNSRVTFTATESGRYYIEASGDRDETGTYTLWVADVTPETVETLETPVVEDPPADGARAGAVDLGDITALEGPRFPAHSLGGEADSVNWFRFTLVEAKRVGLGLRRQDADADLVLEDGEGNELHRSGSSGTANEWIGATLLSGTYYVRVEAREAGSNEYLLRYGVSLPDPGEVERLEAERASGEADPPPAAGSVAEPAGEDFTADTATGGRVLAGESVTGEIGESGDVDWFAVELEAGTTYRFDLLGAGLGGGTLVDPYIRGIHDAEGVLLADTQNNDRGWFYLSSRVDFTPESGGRYYVAAGASGGETGTYRLEVTGFADDYAAGRGTAGSVAVDGSATGDIERAGDVDWHAVALEAGKTYRIDLEGSDTGAGTLSDPWLEGIHDGDGALLAGTLDNDAGEGRNARAVFTAESDGTYYVAAGAAAGTGTYRVSVADITGAGQTARYGPQPRVEVGGSAAGVLEESGDRDWFAVELAGGTRYRFDLKGSDTGSGTLADPRLDGVYDGDGVRLPDTERDGGGEGRESRLDFTPESDGTYYVAAGGHGGEAGSYRFEVAQAPWEVSVSDAEAHEADGVMRFRIGLNWASPSAVTLGYGTVDGTALAGEDYEAASGEVTFAPGETEKWVEVSLLDDFVEDSGETFALRLSGVSGADPVRAEATGTILNNEVAARSIDVGGTLAGRIEASGEIDWYEVELEGGKTYRFDMNKNGGGYFNSHIRGIYDDRNNLQPGTENDDYHAVGSSNFDARVFFTPDAGGTYYVAAGSSRMVSIIYNGNERVIDTGPYRFSVTPVSGDDYSAALPDDVEATPDTLQPGSVDVGGSTAGDIERPGDVDWFEVDLVAGKAYRFQMKGVATGDGSLQDPEIRGIHDSEGNLLPYTGNDNSWLLPGDPRPQWEPNALYAGLGLTQNASVLFTPEESGTYYVSAAQSSPGPGNMHVGTYRLHASEVDLDDDYPVSTATTGTVAVDGSTTGGVDYEGDVDWFAVTLEAGKLYRIDLEGEHDGDGTLKDPFLRGIHDADGSLIEGTADDDGGAGRNSRLFFEADRDGVHYIAAGAHDGYRGTYTLSVTGTPDDFPAGAGTTGAVAVDGSATGDIERAGDRDWFAVTFEAGKTYRIDLEGSPTDAGTLGDPRLRGIHDADGNLIEGTDDDDGGDGRNSRLTFEADADGTHYIAAGARGSDAGTYRVSVTELEDDYAADTGTAGTVAVGGSVTGSIDYPHERDWFAVTLEAGKTYRIDLEGSWTDAGTLGDPWLRGIHDSDGNLISGTDDDDGGDGRNSRLMFRADADGTHYIAAGAWSSDAGTYRVSVTEVEDDYAADTGTAGTVAVGGSVTGSIDYSNDRDWFAVTLKAGKIYRIDLEGSATDAGTLGDPRLRGIHDADGNLISGTADDDGGDGRNSRLTFEADVDGTHYIAAGARGSDAGTYRVSVSVTELEDDYAADTGTAGTVAVGGPVTGSIDYSNDRDWFAVEFEAGKTYRIDLEGSSTDAGTLGDPYLRGIHDGDGNLISGTADDDGGAGYNSRFTFRADVDGTHYIAAGARGSGAGTYRVSVTEVRDDYAADTGTTGTVAVGGSVTGSLDYSNDRDWFAVTFEAGKTYRIDLEGSATGAGTLRDPYLHRIHDSGGNLIADTADDDGGVGYNSRLTFEADRDGTYYIAAGAYEAGASGNGTGTYELSVEEVL